MVKRVVLTGGPGTGKTTILNRILNYGQKNGIKVFLVSETATDLIQSGINCFKDDALDSLDFQELVMRTQLGKEAIFDRAVEMYSGKYPNQDILVVYDRGIIDSVAYMKEEEFPIVFNRLGDVASVGDLLRHYDLVLAMVGKKEFYTTENNEARSESADYAIELGENTIRSWLGHPKLKIVLPKEKIEEKVNETLNYIDSLFTRKAVKRQYKFLVDLDNTDLDCVFLNGKTSEIEQAYLMSDEAEEKRIRKTTFEGSVIYDFAVYKILENGESLLVSSQTIPKTLYNTLMDFKKEGTSVIRKKRTYFSHNGQYFYLDQFDDYVILECNVEISDVVSIPSTISILEDVSFDFNYKNRNLAMCLENKKLKKEW